jgi:hypothetical protein
MKSSPRSKPFLRFALLAIPAVAIFALSLNSCTPEYGMSTEDYDIVITHYDSTFNFGAVSTFAMPDSVIHIVDSSKEDDIDRRYDDLILSEVVKNMESKGYTRELDPENNGSDVVLFVYVTTNTYLFYYYYPWWGYWGWWPGWGYYPPGWGGYYPGYPGYGGAVGSYQTGTLVIDMEDPSAFDEDEGIMPSRWLAAFNGLLNGSNTEKRITDNIAQAFNQSPYLGAKP